jgi:hypothetical protein
MRQMVRQLNDDCSEAHFLIRQLKLATFRSKTMVWNMPRWCACSVAAASNAFFTGLMIACLQISPAKSGIESQQPAERIPVS